MRSAISVAGVVAVVSVAILSVEKPAPLVRRPDPRWELVADAFPISAEGVGGHIGAVVDVDPSNPAAGAGRRLVAVGIGGPKNTDPHTRPGVWLSDDGRVWRQVSPSKIERGESGEAGILMTDVIALSTSRLVAVGYVNYEPAESPAVWLSNDAGESWRRAEGSHPGFQGNGRIEAVTATDSGKLIAVGAYIDVQGVSSPAAWASNDGAVWQPFPSPQDAIGMAEGSLRSVAAQGDVVVAVGSGPSGPLAYVSAAGAAFRRLTTDKQAGDDLASVTASPDSFIAVGRTAHGDGLAYVWDANGRNIDTKEGSGSTHFSGKGTQSLFSVTHVGGLFIAGGEDDGHAAVWLRTNDGWRRAEDANVLSQAKWITNIAATGYGLMAFGNPRGRSADFQTLVWATTPNP